MNPEWYKKTEEMFLSDKNYTEISKELNVGRKTVFDYIYKNASVYLERKYNRYVNFAPTSSNVSGASTNIGEA